MEDLTPQDPTKKNPFEKFQELFKKVPQNLGQISERLKKFSPFLGRLLEFKAPAFFSSIQDKLPEPLRPIFEKHKDRIAVVMAVFILFGSGLVLKNIFVGKGKPKVSLKEVVSQKADEESAPVAVKGFKVSRFNFEDSLNALGTIKGAVEFKLSFEVPGTISSINYREGERYEEGALLVSLRQDDVLLRLKRAQAELNKAQTQVQIAEVKVREHEKLLAMGAIPQTTLDNVKLELDSSRFEAEGARLEVKANEAMLEKSNLYAPSAGMIGQLNIEEGETVSPNTLLGTHIMTEYVYAEFGVVERDVNKIALGQKARVFVDAFPDKTFEGVIENVSPVVAGTSRTATAKVRIENPDRLLLPGMFARIRILLYSKKNTLVVPTDAIQGGEGEQFVYVIHTSKSAGQPKEEGEEGKLLRPESPESPDQKTAVQPKRVPDTDQKQKQASKGVAPAETSEQDYVEKRAITIGYKRPDYSQLDAGLSEGEVVAISGFERLEDGKKVRLLEIQEAEV